MDILKEYGTLSGYKLNIKKTQVITFNYDPPSCIRGRYNLKWDADSIWYIGVDLPKDISKLSNLNYGPLNAKIKTDILRWSLIPFLSLSSRVDSVKISILARLLYLFETLPVAVSAKQFMEWDKLISRYLWQGKKPRIRYKSLQLGKWRFRPTVFTWGLLCSSIEAFNMLVFSIVLREMEGHWKCNGRSIELI